MSSFSQAPPAPPAPPAPNGSPTSVRSRGEEGSAYLLALLVLVLLTVVGLALAFVTQTEMQIGANERTIERLFYAADSGVAAATARVLVAADYAPRVYYMKDEGTTGIVPLRHQVSVSPFFPIQSGPCNLCEINDAGQYGTREYFRVNHVVNSTASRRTADANETPLAQGAVGAMVELQPWKTPPEALVLVDDPEQAAKIKY